MHANWLPDELNHWAVWAIGILVIELCELPESLWNRNMHDQSDLVWMRVEWWKSLLC
jgi:hypothetical protein